MIVNPGRTPRPAWPARWSSVARGQHRHPVANRNEVLVFGTAGQAGPQMPSHGRIGVGIERADDAGPDLTAPSSACLAHVSPLAFRAPRRSGSASVRRRAASRVRAATTGLGRLRRSPGGAAGRHGVPGEGGTAEVVAEVNEIPPGALFALACITLRPAAAFIR